MIFGQDRDQLRNAYIQAWEKARSGLPLEALEQQLAQVIREHPEYHPMLEDPDSAMASDFSPEGGQTNPFLHMGMHLAIREQTSTDRPPGIQQAYQALQIRTSDPHKAEHQIMECLGQALWEAQRANRPPDEAAYLECIRKLSG